jgi:hypothetical protein
VNVNKGLRDAARISLQIMGDGVVPSGKDIVRKKAEVAELLKRSS